MGLRQALMALMEWATNVPQKLLQCDAIHFSLDGAGGNLTHQDFKDNVELISKKS